MCVRIEDSGQYRSARGIDDDCFLRNLEISRLTNCNNAIPLNGNKALGDGIGTRAVNYDPIG